ncbi:hypothetical protein [Clostridioides sp. ZZV14-6150]|uniref:hypothetical protein n=1 Tax=unclassified Clostridioides TaxID=2635829 RepID=UPI001D125F36|nr:hypothetical protein [Clostridioides sp. ZZV14-6150]MCC0724702.1 hypothetical protein [Clostridioides sp. ZZV14-6104]
MPQLLNAFFSWFINKDEKEQQTKISYLKPLFSMGLILLLVCEYFLGNTISVIKDLLGTKVLYYISLILNLGLHFFTILSVVSIILFLCSILLEKIYNRFWKGNKYIYLLRLMHGSIYRFKCSVENTTIFLLAAYILNNDVFIKYKEIYDESSWGLVLSIMLFTFILSILKRIIDTFFVLKPIDIIHEENAELLALKAENQKLREELLILKEAKKY